MIAALRKLNALSHANILATAVERWNAVTRTAPTTVDGYVEQALEGEFNALDNDFHTAPPLQKVLVRHLHENRSFFIEIQ